MLKLRVVAAVSSALIAAAPLTAWAADLIPYSGGQYNSTTYSFTAAADGDLIAYFVGGSGAGITNELGLMVNGVLAPISGLNNHTSSVGDFLNFGHVNAGDTLVFVLHNLSDSKDAFSDASLNAAYDDPSYTGGHNHIYSTAYTATDPLFGGGVPAGIYAGFEDLGFPNSDFNYDDESFVFTNVAAVATAVPEAATWAMMLLGFFGLGATLRDARRKAALPGW
jgi:hypothetical protein